MTLFQTWASLNIDNIDNIDKHWQKTSVCPLNGKIACEKPDSFYETSWPGKNHQATLMIVDTQY